MFLENFGRITVLLNVPIGQLGNGQEMVEKWPVQMLEKWPGKCLKMARKLFKKNGQCKCLEMARKMLEKMARKMLEKRPVQRLGNC